MDLSQAPLLFVLPVLLVCSGLASGSETALFSLTRGERTRLAHESPVMARFVERVLAHPRALLVLVLLCNMLVNVTYFVVVSVLTLNADGLAWRVGLSVGSVLAIILMGEVLAKLAAAGNRVGFLRVTGPLLVLVEGVLGGPASWIDRWVIAPLARLIHPPERHALVPGASADLDSLLAAGAAEGAIDDEERRLLREVVELGDVRVREVMTPRTRLATVTEDDTGDDVADALRQAGAAPVPVLAESDERPVGIIDVSVFLAEPRSSATAAMATVLFTPETARLDALLGRFAETGARVALVVNEHGELAGVVTAEDLSDELLSGLGESGRSEHERVQLVGLGRWVAPGALPVRDWVESFIEVLPDRDAIDQATADAIAAHGRVSTLGGLIAADLGRVPVEGDSIAIGGVRLIVLAMDGRAVETVEIALEPEKLDDSAQLGTPPETTP